MEPMSVTVELKRSSAISTLASSMKPSIHESSSSSSSSSSSASRRPVENAENCKWRVGTRVERELDGLWFPGTIVRVDEGDGSFEVEYDEDQNRESDITSDELRLLQEEEEEQEEEQEGNDQLLRRPRTASGRPQTASGMATSKHSESHLLLQPSDYDPNKTPTVVLHHRGESHAAASAYIINGLENNIAAGNGLRGIRWLRVNTM